MQALVSQARTQAVSLSRGYPRAQKLWVESNTGSLCGSRAGGGGKEKKGPWLSHLHNSFGPIPGWPRSCGKTEHIFFSAKKEHLVLAWMCKLWVWSSNLILICQHLKRQPKDDVSKSSATKLHWPLAQLGRTEAPESSQNTLGIPTRSPEPSASVTHS